MGNPTTLTNLQGEKELLERDAEALRQSMDELRRAGLARDSYNWRSATVIIPDF